MYKKPKPSQSDNTSHGLMLPHSGYSYSWQELPIIFSLALGYALLSFIVLSTFASDGVVSLIWPLSGIGLATLVLLGQKYWLVIFLGALMGNYMAGSPLVLASTIAFGNALEAVIGSWTLSYYAKVNLALSRPRDYFWIAIAGAIAASVSALTGNLALLLSHHLEPSTFIPSLITWWQGDLLGIILITPLILVWRNFPHYWLTRAGLLELAFLLTLTYLFGQIIFFGQHAETFSPLNQNYWFFLFVAWATVRFGRHGSLLIISMVVLQALLAAIRDIDLLGKDIVQQQLNNLWFFTLVLTGVGTTLSLVLKNNQLLKQELVESKQFTNDTFDALSSHIYVLDNTGNILAANQNAQKNIHGYSQLTNPIGCNYLTVCDRATGPDSAEALLMAAGIRSVLNGKQDSFTLEYPCHNNAEKHWFIVRVTRFHRNNPFVVIAHEEITERKMAEMALRDSEKKLRTLFEMSPLGITRNSMDGHFLEANQAMLDMTGYTLAEIIKRSYWQLTPQDYETQELEQLKALAESGRYGPYEKEYIHRDGHRIAIRLNGIKITHSDGEQSIWSIIEDVTQLRRDEERLHLMAKVFSAMAEAIIICDPKNQIIATNPAFTTLTGYTQEEALGKNPSFLSAGETSEEIYREMWSSIFRRDFWQGELLDKRKSGEFYTKWLSITVVRDEHRNVTNYLGIFTDISKLKRIEKELRDMNEQLETRVNERTRELSHAQEQADVANQAKSAFLANMSHEIRTPMNAIIGLTQLTLDTELSDKQRDYLSKVHISSKALLNILNDVLDYSKIEAGKLDLEQVEFTLEDVLKSVSDLFSAKITEKGLELFLEIDHSIKHHLLGDPLRLGQILTNLVDNAIKFTAQGEVHLKVETLQTSDQEITVRFSVRDTGIGMDKEQTERLFTAFSQADTSITRKYGGTGLGLTISKRLVRMMGGAFALTSTPGQGSTFSFTATFGLGNENLEPYQHHELYGMRALVVDDQETSLVIMEQYLHSWQFDVTVTTSAIDALELIKLAEREHQPYEILLLDWKMPEMDGLELVRHLELFVHEGTIKHAPSIIMVSAHEREFLFNGTTHFQHEQVLIKPVTPSSLFSSLHNIQKPQEAKQFAIKKHTQPTDLYELATPIHGARILLVEDNEINQEVAQEILNKAGLTVSIASHGGKAVEAVNKTKFDAILMDLQMPVMDGFMATQIIRSLPQGTNLPIIALSAAAMAQDQQACAQAGMDGHISKPIDPEQLITCLLNHIEPNKLTPARNGENNTNAPPKNLPANLPGFNLAEALVRLGNNQTLLTKLLLRFASEYAPAADKIEQLLSQNQHLEATDLLHRIRGAAANLGALALADAVQQLEMQICAENTLTAQDSFKQHLEAAILAIRTHISPIAQPTIAQGVDPSQIRAELDKLSACLSEQSLIPDEQLANLLSNLVGHTPLGLLLDLDRELHHFNFEAARNILAQINESLPMTPAEK